MYTGEQESEDLLRVPSVDAPLAKLSSAALIPSDMVEGLKAKDRKAELSSHKTHQAAAWAIRSATAASFFTRTSLIWLHQLQARVAPEDTRLHQDICKLITTAEFSADVTLNTAKFASRALTSNVTS